MALQILASLLLVYWLMQSNELTTMTWGEGYSSFWVVFQAIATAALIIPFIAIWL